MKILAIMGSPRKNGNTYRIVSQLEQRLKELGDVEFEYLFLADAKLGLCRGCCLCFGSGEDKCPHKDDRERIEQKLLAADGVIFASPVYAMDMTALMKNLLDRFAYTMHRPRFFKQYTFIVSVSAGSGLKETISRISVLKYCGFNIVGSLAIGTFDFQLVSQETKDKIQKKVSAAADKFYQTIHKNRKYSPSFENLIAFHAQKTAYTMLKDHLPCDYAYFKERGWLDKKARYYFAARINPVKEWAVRLILRLAFRSSCKQILEIQRRTKR